MSAERDRLAADLHEVMAGAPGLGDRPDLWLAAADRLIALGWHNVKSPEFVDGLARRFHAAGCVHVEGEPPLCEFYAAIAKAYREDSEP